MANSGIPTLASPSKGRRGRPSTDRGSGGSSCSSLMAICCGCRLAEPAGQRGVQNHDHAFHGINPQPPLTRQLDFCHTGQHTWERLEALAAASQRCAGEPVWPKSQCRASKLATGTGSTADCC